MRCLRPFRLPSGLTVNCGSCRSCRVNRSTSWTIRLLYELEDWQEAAFITLTYSDEKIPEDYGLHKSELSGFIKRLRSRFAALGSNIRFFGVGEYGTDNRSMPIGFEHGRPHYHIIVFGVDAENEEHRKIIYECWKRCDSYLLISGRGVERVNRATCAYVAGYIQKKLNGNFGKEVYEDRQPPFMLCSKRLGLKAFERKKDRLFNTGFLYYGQNKIGIPRYFRQKYDYHLDFEDKGLALATLADKFENEKHLEFNSVSQKKRFFDDWLRKKQFDYADAVDKDFRQKQKIRGGKI